MTGADPETAARAMVEEGADAVGANCGAGPEAVPPHLPASESSERVASLDQAQRGATVAGSRSDRSIP